MVRVRVRVRVRVSGAAARRGPVRADALLHTVAGSITYGCRLRDVRLQAVSPTVAGPVPYGCRHVPGLPTELLAKDDQLDKKSMRRQFKGARLQLYVMDPAAVCDGPCSRM